MSQQTLDELFRLGGWLLVFAVLVAIGVYQALKHISGKWLDGKFNQRLEQFKADQDRELRRLQSQIDRELDRARLIQNQEFAVLRDAWNSLYHAFWITRQATSRMQSRYDFNHMSEGQAQEFIQNVEIADWQRAELSRLQRPDERNAYYWEARKWITLNDCQKARRECLKIVDTGAIYLTPEIKKLFIDVLEMVQSALIEFEIYIPEKHRAEVRKYERSDALQHDGIAQLSKLEQMIHARLWEPVKQANPV